MKLILGSGSPRRKELLSQMGFRYKSCVADFDESAIVLSDPGQGVCDLAEGKAKAAKVKWETEHPDDTEDFVVLGADTIVVLDGVPMGKPKDEEDAIRTLKSLSGRSHSVYTGVALVYGDEVKTLCSKTDVYFYDLSDEEIRRYVDSGEPMDKAGSYGIQGLGRILIRKIDGDYFTVVGLPVAEVYRALTALGVEPKF